HACVAFPVTVGTDVVAVIEVCADRVETPSEALTLALETVGAILGRAFERERHTHDVAEQALVDPLTGLASRRAFLLLAAQQVKIAARMQRTPTLLALELAAVAAEDADLAMKDAASLVKSGFRESDLVGRIGERTFAIFAIDTSPNQADALRERIRRNVDSFNQIRRRRYTLSFTTGVTVFDPNRPQKIATARDRTLAGLRPLGGPQSVRRSA